jgi:hypothetical protein
MAKRRVMSITVDGQLGYSEMQAVETIIVFAGPDMYTIRYLSETDEIVILFNDEAVHSTLLPEDDTQPTQPTQPTGQQGD